MVRAYLALVLAGVAVFAVACQSDGESGGGSFGEDELSRERCEELSDIKPGNLIIFDESLTDEQKLDCTSLLFSTPSATATTSLTPSLTPEPTMFW